MPVQQYSETVLVRINKSEFTKVGQIIISVTNASTISGNTDFVVGRIGMPSVRVKGQTVGSAVFYETPDEGLFEIRVMEILSEYSGGDYPKFRVSRVAPLSGILAGYIEHDASNTPFEQPEVIKLTASLGEIKSAMAERDDINPEQLDFLNRKLDDLLRATDRLGRKDWINLVIGTLTNVVVSAAFAAAPARFLFQVTGSALLWLTSTIVQLLSP